MTALLLAVLMRAPDNWVVFTDSTSKSGRYAIAWSVSGHDLRKEPDVDRTSADINQVVDLKVHRVVALLPGWQAFPGENHGGLAATYSPDERCVAVVHAGKWEPREVALASTTGCGAKQVWSIVQKAGLGYFRKSPYPYVLDVAKVEMKPGRAVFDLLAQVPKSEDAPLSYVVVTLHYRLTKHGLQLGKASAAHTKQQPEWFKRY